MRFAVYGVLAVTMLAACGTHPTGLGQAAGAGALRAASLRADVAGSFTQEKFGERSYKLYVPKSLAKTPLKPAQPAPLVVMLHGCPQDPDQFAAGTRMNQLAEREGFYVMYPDQPRLAHPFKCWRWFDPASQQRGKGEPAAIAGMVEQVAKGHALDRGAVFVAGISAGAAMATNMGATYPDVFAAVCVASGLEFRAATSEATGQQAMSKGGPDPRVAGRDAYATMGGQARLVPTIVFHGGDDRIVAPLNADQGVGQWATTNDLALDGQENGDVDALPDGKEEGQAPNGKRFTRWFYQDKAGHVVLEKVVVTGMGHAWSGGDSAGSYTDPQGPDATAMTWRFFAAHRRPAAAGR